MLAFAFSIISIASNSDRVMKTVGYLVALDGRLHTRQIISIDSCNSWYRLVSQRPSGQCRLLGLISWKFDRNYKIVTVFAVQQQEQKGDAPRLRSNGFSGNNTWLSYGLKPYPQHPQQHSFCFQLVSSWINCIKNLLFLTESPFQCMVSLTMWMEEESSTAQINQNAKKIQNSKNFEELQVNRKLQ